MVGLYKHKENKTKCEGNHKYCRKKTLYEVREFVMTKFAGRHRDGGRGEGEGGRCA